MRLGQKNDADCPTLRAKGYYRKNFYLAVPERWQAAEYSRLVERIRFPNGAKSNFDDPKFYQRQNAMKNGKPVFQGFVELSFDQVTAKIHQEVMAFVKLTTGGYE